MRLKCGNGRAMNSILLCCAFLLLLVCAAFFSGAETAVTAISKAEYRTLKKKSERGAQRLAQLVEIKDKIVTTALIGTNFVNTLNSSLITAFTINVFGTQALPAATAVSTVLIIIAAEIFPKALATERPEAFGMAAALPLSVCYTVLRPLAALFSLLSKGLLRACAAASKDSRIVLKKRDLQLLVHIGQQDGALADGEEPLLEKAILLQNVKLRTIMTPHTAIISIDADASFAQCIAQFKNSGFSRLPVYDSGKKTVTGIIHYKDILFALQERRQPPLSSLLRSAIFIPESNSVLSVIKIMNTNAQNMVIVIDEYGDVAGLLTMDDIIAAVFSHVQDEYGSVKTDPVHAVRLLNEHEISIPGTMSIEDCNELLHTDFRSDYYDTIGGFLLEQWGYLPHTDETIVCGSIVFTAKRIVNRRIDEIIADISATV